jgi:hypothetical protein
MVDDRLRLLAAMKKFLQDRRTSVLPRRGHDVHRGHYALDLHILSTNPQAGLAIGRIGDLLNCDFPALSRPATAVDGE